MSIEEQIAIFAKNKWPRHAPEISLGTHVKYIYANCTWRQAANLITLREGIVVFHATGLVIQELQVRCAGIECCRSVHNELLHTLENMRGEKLVIYVLM
jgi:hypothetical protein